MGLIVLLVATSGAFVASSTQSSPARKQRHFLLVHQPFDLHWHDIAGRDVDDVPRLKCLQASLKETLGHADQPRVVTPTSPWKSSWSSTRSLLLLAPVIRCFKSSGLKCSMTPGTSSAPKESREPLLGHAVTSRILTPYITAEDWRSSNRFLKQVEAELTYVERLV